MTTRPHDEEESKKKNYTLIDNWVFEESRLTPGAKLMLLLLHR